jgi:cytochrome c553
MTNKYLTVVALVLSLITGASLADEIDPVARATAVRLAVGVCGTCHGPRRGDPDAIGYMWGMAGNLEDGTIDALAQYYAGQTAGGAQGGDNALVARGKVIYEQGLAAVGVPACAACHGPDAHGMGDFPRLAGQHAQYVLKQLNSFQSNMRNVAVMHGVAQGMKTGEMSAVAAFLEAQP